MQKTSTYNSVDFPTPGWLRITDFLNTSDKKIYVGLSHLILEFGV